MKHLLLAFIPLILLADEIELKPLLPISGDIPIQIDEKNKLNLKFTEEERTLNQARVEQKTFPWKPIVLFIFIGGGLYILVQRQLQH